jgi:hypothetical protein
MAFGWFRERLKYSSPPGSWAESTCYSLASRRRSTTAARFIDTLICPIRALVAKILRRFRSVLNKF